MTVAYLKSSGFLTLLSFIIDRVGLIMLFKLLAKYLQGSRGRLNTGLSLCEKTNELKTC